MRHRVLTLALIVSAAMSPHAIAQDAAGPQMSEEADQLLWCGAAFRLMGAVGETEEEIANAFLASEMLTQRAALMLYAQGYSEQEGVDLIEDYDERVIADFEAGNIPLEGDACIQLLELPAPRAE